jgi:hypothetical protein
MEWHSHRQMQGHDLTVDLAAVSIIPPVALSFECASDASTPSAAACTSMPLLRFHIDLARQQQPQHGAEYGTATHITSIHSKHHKQHYKPHDTPIWSRTSDTPTGSAPNSRRCLGLRLGVLRLMQCSGEAWLDLRQQPCLRCIAIRHHTSCSRA